MVDTSHGVDCSFLFILAWQSCLEKLIKNNESQPELVQAVYLGACLLLMGLQLQTDRFQPAELHAYTLLAAKFSAGRCGVRPAKGLVQAVFC